VGFREVLQSVYTNGIDCKPCRYP